MVQTRSTFGHVLLVGLVAGFVYFLAQSLLPANSEDPADPDTRTTLALMGETMGTTYRVLLQADSVATEARRQELSRAITARLYHLDRELMSTYSPDSELSRFNTMQAGEFMAISPELLDVIDTAQSVHGLSGGAFDITIKPLVDLWGFGPEASGDQLPDNRAITQARAKMGMDKLQLLRESLMASKTAPVSLDLSAIAKGYAVDEVAALLDREGLVNYVVEIGGEVISRGTRSDGTPWRLGIETPASGESTLFQVIRTGKGKLAMAGSGGYRNFFVRDGRRYSHAIDPVTGQPVNHKLISVTVVAVSATQADAWATALLVMGPEAGMKRANELQLAAYFIVAGTVGYESFYSEAFNQYLPDKQ